MQSRLAFTAGRVLSRWYWGASGFKAGRPVSVNLQSDSAFSCVRVNNQRAAGHWVRTYASSSLNDVIKSKTSEQKVVVYGKYWCGFTDDVVSLLSNLNVEYENIDLEEIPEGEDMLDALYDITGVRTVPQVFVGGQFIGGCDGTIEAYRSGKLKKLFEEAGVTSTL